MKVEQSLTNNHSITLAPLRNALQSLKKRTSRVVKDNYSHSPARVTPPLIVTPGLLNLPQIRTSIFSTVMMFDITQTLSVYNSEQ